MCGINGICSVESITNRSWLVAGRDKLSHRGPDDFGEWWSDDGRVGLAHRRLSILDLTKTGHQPMRDKRHGLVITFNGEIYNFRELYSDLEQCGYEFFSTSDIE